MGLAVGSVTSPTLVRRDGDGEVPDELWDREDVHHVYDNPDFPGRLGGRPGGFYAGEFEPGPRFSYSGYGLFREFLSEAAFGVSPASVWDDPDRYAEGAYGGLVAVVNFADNEGALGPEVARRVADALVAVRGPFERAVRAAGPPAWMDDEMRLFDAFAACFRRAAAGDGFVVFS